MYVLWQGRPSVYEAPYIPVQSCVPSSCQDRLNVGWGPSPTCIVFGMLAPYWGFNKEFNVLDLRHIGMSSPFKWTYLHWNNVKKQRPRQLTHSLICIRSLHWIWVHAHGSERFNTAWNALSVFQLYLDVSAWCRRKKWCGSTSMLLI